MKKKQTHIYISYTYYRYLYIYVYIYIYIYIYTYIYTHVFEYIHIYIYIYMCVNIWIVIYIYKYLFVYIRTRVCVCVMCYHMAELCPLFCQADMTLLDQIFSKERTLSTSLAEKARMSEMPGKVLGRKPFWYTHNELYIYIHIIINM